MEVIPDTLILLRQKVTKMNPDIQEELERRNKRL
jgi:hypothetical protein